MMVYETESLYQFLDQINELGPSEGPVYTAIYRTTAQMAELFRTHRESS